MDEITPEEMAAIEKALLTREFLNLIGAEEWDLSEEDEKFIWSAIMKIRRRS